MGIIQSYGKILQSSVGADKNKIEKAKQSLLLKE